MLNEPPKRTEWSIRYPSLIMGDLVLLRYYCDPYSDETRISDPVGSIFLGLEEGRHPAFWLLKHMPGWSNPNLLRIADYQVASLDVISELHNAT